MEFYRFDSESGKEITAFNSDFIMSRVIQTKEITHIGCMHLQKNGVVGYHQAVSPQLMLIVAGEGDVRSEDGGYYNIKSGEAVFWEKGEWHETKTTSGLTAIVIESEELSPSSYMVRKEVDVE